MTKPGFDLLAIWEAMGAASKREKNIMDWWGRAVQETSHDDLMMEITKTVKPENYATEEAYSYDFGRRHFQLVRAIMASLGDPHPDYPNDTADPDNF